jgi:hypothetical protein
MASVPRIARITHNVEDVDRNNLREKLYTKEHSASVECTELWSREPWEIVNNIHNA